MQKHCMAPDLSIHCHLKTKGIYLLLYNVLNTGLFLVAFTTRDVFVLSGFNP